MHQICKILVVLFFFQLSYGQIGGKNAFEFINLPLNAKVSGIGGENVSVRDGDPNMIFHNPALLNADMKYRAGVNYRHYFADIAATSAVYAFDIKNLGVVAAALQYVNYGNAKSTDATGLQNGEVSASEFAFTATHSRTIENYSLGVNVKFAGSQIASYSSYGLMTDIGGVFKHPTKDLTLGLLIKNIGFPVKNYDYGRISQMPFDVQAGVTYKLAHMPLRLSITIHHLYVWDISYDDPKRVTSYDINGNPQRERVSVVDNIARHFVIGGEFLLAKGFHIRTGYNHFRRSELKLENETGLSGFSIGCMLKIKAVELAYTSAFYHVAGGNNVFSIIVSLDKFFKKPEIPKEAVN